MFDVRWLIALAIVMAAGLVFLADGERRLAADCEAAHGSD